MVLLAEGDPATPPPPEHLSSLFHGCGHHPAPPCRCDRRLAESPTFAAVGFDVASVVVEMFVGEEIPLRAKIPPPVCGIWVDLVTATVRVWELGHAAPASAFLDKRSSVPRRRIQVQVQPVRGGGASRHSELKFRGFLMRLLGGSAVLDYRRLRSGRGALT